MKFFLLSFIIVSEIFSICIGDLNENNGIDSSDLTLLVGSVINNNSFNQLSDINLDLQTNIFDLMILSDYISNNINPCEVLWGETTTVSPEYYFTSDIDSVQINQVKEYYEIARSAWGGYGPLEFWIIGTEIPAAMHMDEYYCEIRMEKDNCLGNDFLQWCLLRDYSFEDYANYGGAGLSLNRENPNNACSGYSYMEITLSSQFPFPNETDYNVVTMHEYFHAYQHSHIYTFDYDERSELMVENPWWSEGGAEYMAQLLYSQQTGVSINYLQERMIWKMNSKNDLLEGELISDIPYGERAYIAYDLGSWAIAYLISLSDLDTYRKDFYNDLNQHGWEESFSMNFNMSSDEFLVSFHEFLELDINQQIVILP